MESYLIVKEARGGWSRFDLETIKRWLSEKVIGDYAEKMKVLKEVDKNIDAWNKDLKKLYNKAVSAFKGQRLVDLTLYLNDINNNLKFINQEGTKVKEVAEESVSKFEQESELDRRSIPEISFSAEDGLMTQAGFWDRWKREYISNKLQTEQRRLRNHALSDLLKSTQSIIKEVDKKVEILGEERNHGNIGKYIDVLNQLATIQRDYQTSFQVVFEKHLKPIIDQVKAEENKRYVEQQSAKMVLPVDVPKMEPSAPEMPTPPEISESVPEVPEASELPKISDLPKPSKPMSKSKKTPVSLEPTPMEDEIPEDASEFAWNGPTTERVPELPDDEPMQVSEDELLPESGEQTKQLSLEFPEEKAKTASGIEYIIHKKQHQDFIVEMIKAAHQYRDPVILAQMMLKYSEKLEDQDLDKSLKLMAIVEGILDS